MAGPKQIDLEYTRRDTKTISFTRSNKDGTRKDISGFSYVFRVDTMKDPPDGSTIVFTVAGVITLAAQGEFGFPISTVESDQTPAVYYYRIIETDGAPEEETIATGQWALLEDIRP